jgi:hypothetical protein
MITKTFVITSDALVIIIEVWGKTYTACTQTHTWTWLLLEKLTVAPLVKNFLSILWNRKVHNHIHKSPPLVRILNQINSAQALPSNFLWSVLILSSHIHLGLRSGNFHSAFPTVTVAALSLICATCLFISPPLIWSLWFYIYIYMALTEHEAESYRREVIKYCM